LLIADEPKGGTMADQRPPPAKVDALDPRGVIGEAYRIDGITPEDCRSIFFDWALGRGEAEGDPDAAAGLLARHEPAYPDHPMTEVLREGRRELRPPARRRGRQRPGGQGDVPR
jgi:hypothetical protein